MEGVFFLGCEPLGYWGGSVDPQNCDERDEIHFNHQSQEQGSAKVHSLYNLAAEWAIRPTVD